MPSAFVPAQAEAPNPAHDRPNAVLEVRVVRPIICEATIAAFGYVSGGTRWFRLPGRTSFAQLGTALFLLPVVGVAAGIFTGDRPEPIELAGIAAVLAGIRIVSAGRTPAPPGGGVADGSVN